VEARHAEKKIDSNTQHGATCYLLSKQPAQVVEVLQLETFIRHSQRTARLPLRQNSVDTTLEKKKLVMTSFFFVKVNFFS
jgi:hypothetical protein